MQFQVTPGSGGSKTVDLPTRATKQRKKAYFAANILPEPALTARWGAGKIRSEASDAPT